MLSIYETYIVCIYSLYIRDLYSMLICCLYMRRMYIVYMLSPRTAKTWLKPSKQGLENCSLTNQRQEDRVRLLTYGTLRTLTSASHAKVAPMAS